jgi:hypothetical protein
VGDEIEGFPQAFPAFFALFGTIRIKGICKGIEDSSVSIFQEILSLNLRRELN